MSALQPIHSAVEQRSFTIAHNALWARRGMPWMLRKYGHGHWCVAHGEPSYFATEGAAYLAGNRWLENGAAA